MDFDEAREQHRQWRARFRDAIRQKHAFDAAAIAKDDQCALGKWLHGEAETKFSRLASYTDCVRTHANFHLAAGNVAQAIDEEKYMEAWTLLGAESEFSLASAKIVSAIDILQNEVAVSKN